MPPVRRASMATWWSPATSTQRRMWEVAGGDTVRFQQAVQHATSIMLLLDRGGCITSVNGAFTRLLGHDPSVAVGQRARRRSRTPVGATELADAPSAAASRPDAPPPARC